MKPVKLFPNLESIDDFVIKEHPILHPDSKAYSDYWEQQERYCVEGKWGKDGQKWRYCPGNLYYYSNFTVIEDEDDKKSTELKRPRLRDIDWYITYGWLTARGFSGFMDDDNYTCNIIIKKIEDNIPLTPTERLDLERLSHLRRRDGRLKKYIEAREYLYNKCEYPMGLAIYDNPSRNLFLLSTRGLGKSFYVANAVVGHEFIFYGKKYYNDYIMDAAKGPQVFVGASLSSKSSDLLKKFDLTQEYHKANNGSFGSGDDLIPGFFYRNCTGTLTPNNSKSPYIHQYEVKEGGVRRKLGSKTTLYHGIYTTENPDAAVGTRPTIMVVEESGLVENIIPVHIANEQCQFRKTKFGSSFYIGTGGNIDKIVGCKLLFENPREYQFLEYPDLWEDRQYPIGLFIPAYYGNTKFLDDKGNTDIELAFEQEMYERALREKSKSSAALDGYKMARPIVPSEMFLSRSSFVFPVIELRERQMELDVKKIWERNVSIGDLEWADLSKRSVRWVEDISNQRFSKPINTLNLDSFGGDLTGKICIYEHPNDLIPNPNHIKSLYKIVYDPIKDDEYGTSLASILVYKGFTDIFNDGLQGTIVAEWIGRYNQVYDAHLMAVKLALYYNAKILAENNFPNFITFCKSEGYYHLLQRTPWAAIKDAVGNPGRKYDVGVTMSSQLNVNCEQLIRQWLLEPFLKLEDRMLCNIHNLYSFRLINELAAYSRDGNFDHVSSLKLLMLWISQEKKTIFTEQDVKPDKFYDELGEFNKSNTINIRIEYDNWYKY